MMMNVLAFGVLGMLTSVIIGMVVSEVKRPMLILFLILQGMFFGWLAGLIWFYLTGTISIDTVSVLIPVFISAFFTIITLAYLPTNLWDERFNKVSERATAVSLVLLIIIAVSVAFTAMPISLASTFSTERFELVDTWEPNRMFITEQNIDLFSAKSTSNDVISFQVATKAISGLRLMDEPEVKNYFDFQVSMDVEGLWSRPYLKIAVFEDADGDGKLSVGDVMWADVNYKLVHNLGSYWRSNCVWEDGEPVASAFTTRNHILPIFHAKTLSQWKDETNVNFRNTPEGYITPYDMLSWNKTGFEIEAMETVMEWAVIEDTVVSIKGRIYCPEGLLGNHFVLVRAYDASYTNPSDETAEPIASKLINFEIKPESTGIGSEWYVFAGLGGLLVVGVVAQRKEDWF